MCRYPPKLSEGPHCTVVSSAAGAPDCDDGVVFLTGDRDFKSDVTVTGHPGTSIEDCANKKARYPMEVARGLDAKGNGYARLSNERAFNSGRLQSCDVDGPHSFAGAAHERVRRRIATRRQYTLARRNRCDGFGSFASQYYSVEWQHGICTTRHRLPNVNTASGRQQRHWRIGTGIGNGGRSYGETITQRDRMFRTLG
jgi:hypothetical protein